MSAPKHSTSFIGKRQRSQICTASTILHIPESRGTTAGLALYKDDCRHIEISYNSNTHSVSLMSCFKAKGSPRVLGERLVTTASVHMKVSATTHLYGFWVCEECDSNWVLLGSIQASEMSGYDFTGTIFGIWTCTTGFAEAESVQFEAFRVSEGEKERTLEDAGRES